jgi:hypothetical protein
MESRSRWRRLITLFSRQNQIAPLLPAPAPELAAVRALEAARSLIADEHEWVQGAFTSGGRHCAMGALDAVTRLAAQRDARRLARGFLHDVATRHGFSRMRKKARG